MIDVALARAHTPGSEKRVHLDNARASLMPAPVLAAVKEHLDLEAEVGGAEAAELRADAIEHVYAAVASLLNARPHEITIYTDGALEAMSLAQRYVLDASGAVGRTAVDVRSLEHTAIVARADAYLRAPAGTGFLYLRSGRRVESTPSPATMLGLGRAIEYARDWGLDAIEARTDRLAGELRGRLAELAAVSVRSCDGIVSFEVARRDPRDVAWALRKRGITVAVNGTGVRVSPHYFNTEEELEQLATAVAAL